MISASGERDIEFIYEDAGRPRNEAADKLGGVWAGSTDHVLGVDRLRRPAAHGVLPFDGDTFEPLGRPRRQTFANSDRPGGALRHRTLGADAFFDSIRFEPDGRRRRRRSEVVDEFDGSALESPPWAVGPPDPGPGGQRRRAAHPAAQGDMYVPRQRQQFGAAGRARRRLGGDHRSPRRHGAVPRGRADRVRRRRHLHDSAASAHCGGRREVEFIYEDAGVPRNEAADSRPPAGRVPAGLLPAGHIRRHEPHGADSDDGAAWTPLRRPAPLPGNARVGMFAFNNQATASPKRPSTPSG